MRGGPWRRRFYLRCLAVTPSAAGDGDGDQQAACAIFKYSLCFESPDSVLVGKCAESTVCGSLKVGRPACVLKVQTVWSSANVLKAQSVALKRLDVQLVS